MFTLHDHNQEFMGRDKNIYFYLHEAASKILQHFGKLW